MSDIRKSKLSPAIQARGSAPSAPTGLVDKPTASLSDLDLPPNYRGCTDDFKDGILWGWALSTENPLRAVTLEVWLAEVKLTRLVTGKVRPDVSKRLGLPVAAGYSIDFKTIPENKAREALAYLRNIQQPAMRLADLISVRVEGTECSLPLSSVACETVVEIAPLIATLRKALETSTENHRALLCKDLLEAHSLPLDGDDAEVRVVAYYLPQFHPFAENDEWWGVGFTEWTNVTIAKPFYKDHYQPHLPADMGFYDLRLDQIQRDQIALAKRYGVTGFCYYYYWFSGKTLMTLPIDRHVEQDLDMDFCL